MDDEVLDEDLVVEEGVPETQEDTANSLDEIETDASEGVEEDQEATAQGVVRTDEDIEREFEERVNKAVEEKIETRLARDRVKRERETEERFSKYKQLESIVGAGLGTDNLDEIISKTSEFYREQGINIPVTEKRQLLNERDAIILARADAQDVIKCGEKEMEDEANRIAGIPRDERSFRENVMFDELCKELISMRNIKELKDKGYDVKVLESDDFKEFSKDINKPITDVYEMYMKINGMTKQAPKSPGSAKTTVAVDEVKEYYSPEEARRFTEEDFEKNPKLEAAVERSMLKWRR